MRKTVRLLPLILLIIGIFFIPLSAHAEKSEKDFGNIAGDNDYDYDSVWEVETPTTAPQYSGSTEEDSSGCMGCDGCFGLDRNFILLAIVVVLTVIVLGIIIMNIDEARAKRRARREAKKKQREEAETDDSHKLRTIAEYLSLDPSFSPDNFKNSISDLYVSLQHGWQDKDISPFRKNMTDAFFAQMERELDKYRTRKQTNCIEKIAVFGTEILGWRQDGGKDMIIVQLRTYIIDYVRNDLTGELIRGSRTLKKNMVYEWSMIRPSGMKTDESADAVEITCPKCGAKVMVNQTAKCEFCGTLLTSDRFNWALNNITGLSQHTLK